MGIEVWDPNEPVWTGNQPQWLPWQDPEAQAIWDDDNTAPRHLRWRRTPERPTTTPVFLTVEQIDWLQELLRGALVEPNSDMEEQVLEALAIAADPARELEDFEAGRPLQEDHRNA